MRRRKAGETTLTIRKGRVVAMGTVVLSRPTTASSSGSENIVPDGCHPPVNRGNPDQTAHSDTGGRAPPEQQKSNQA